MPGSISTIQGSQPVEYVEESTFGSGESDPSMSWIGLVSSFSSSIMAETEVVKYLPDDSNAIDLQTLTAEKTSELHEVEVTYNPQDLGFFQYFMGSSGSLDSELTSIQFGEQDKNNGEFHRMMGCVGEEITLSIENDAVAEVSASFISAETEDWSGSDYVGGGSHATATDPSTTPPLVWDDLGNVNWGGSAIGHSVDSLELTISNSLEVVKDANSTLGTKVGAITPVDREITVDLGFTYSDMSMASDIRSFTKQDLTFDFGPSDETWTVADAAFPEFPYEFGPEDLVADSVSTLPATNLTYS